MACRGKSQFQRSTVRSTDDSGSMNALAATNKEKFRTKYALAYRPFEKSVAIMLRGFFPSFYYGIEIPSIVATLVSRRKEIPLLTFSSNRCSRISFQRGFHRRSLLGLLARLNACIRTKFIEFSIEKHGISIVSGTREPGLS